MIPYEFENDSPGPDAEWTRILRQRGMLFAEAAVLVPEPVVSKAGREVSDLHEIAQVLLEALPTD